VAHALAGRIRRIRPRLDVQAAFLDHSAPSLTEALSGVAREDRSAVVVPMLLASAYHATVDIPAVIASVDVEARRADVLGEDPALITVLGQRLAEGGFSSWDRDLGVIVLAVGSSRDAANARTATVAARLGAGTRWAGTEIAFATGPRPTLTEAADRLRARGARRLVVAPWFLATGALTDRVAKAAARQHIAMCEPLGAHNLVAATLLDRYDATAAALAAA
jgi:sirohydrochlorin ferrochelatase